MIKYFRRDVEVNVDRIFHTYFCCIVDVALLMPTTIESRAFNEL